MWNNYLTPPESSSRQQCFGSTSTLNLSLPDQPLTGDGKNKDLTNVNQTNGKRRRRLLLVYIHGFMGSEASFNEFPMHVHQILSIALNESHVVFTKIYPRYRSRGEIEIAREGFSQWLSPHEAPDLDVILLGHSLGGILAAEVALTPSAGEGPDGLAHRILGLVNFDVPFLGIHPGVITAGIGSLFRRKQDEVNKTSNLTTGEGGNRWDLLADGDNENQFDPSFNNDIHLTQKRRGLNGAFHFLHKHKDHLTSAVPQYFVSYYDHFGCLGDYSELRARYQRLQELEHGNGGGLRGSLQGSRVRFINYYTVSTGYTKKEKEKEARRRDKWLLHKSRSDTNLSCPDHSQEGIVGNQAAGYHLDLSLLRPGHQLESELESSDGGKGGLKSGYDDSSDLSRAQDCSPLSITETNTNHKLTCPEGNNRSVTATHSEDTDEGLKSRARDRKFCWVPRESNGSIDPLWARIFMEGIDEVAAHQTLFLPNGPYYDELVGDTAARIEGWVQDDLTRRAILAEEMPCGV